jgi:hypothetical protein
MVEIPFKQHTHVCTISVRVKCFLYSVGFAFWWWPIMAETFDAPWHLLIRLIWRLSNCKPRHIPNVEKARICDGGGTIVPLMTRGNRGNHSNKCMGKAAGYRIVWLYKICTLHYNRNSEHRGAKDAMWKLWVLGEDCDRREMKWREIGANCIMRSFITCTPRQT